MSFKVGDKVTCSAEYNYTGTTHLASFVRTNTYEIIQVGGRNLPDDRIVIGINGQVTAAVKASELSLLGGTPAPTPAPAPAPEPAPTPVPLPQPEPYDPGGVAAVLSARNNQPIRIPASGSGNVQKTGGFSTASAQIESRGTVTQNRAAKGPEVNTYDSWRNVRHPTIVQNSQQFPPVKSYDSRAGYYRYNYYQDYERDGLMSDYTNLKKSLSLEIGKRADLYAKYIDRYNKFKIGNSNDKLVKTFSHVFFVRPDCNIFEGSQLNSDVKNLSEFYYAYQHIPKVLAELTQSRPSGLTDPKYNHEFSLLLSNKAKSFELQGEMVESETYGQALTGYSIPYGKHNVASRAAGKFSIKYTDDRDLRVYNLHKLWIEYISHVYRGKLLPNFHYIMNRVLDYPTCVYYFVTAEDGETIIFWSKYWGVFPLDAPSNAFSYSSENGGGFNNPELDIEYQYAWKEDFNPLSIVEFNGHSRGSPYIYTPSYQAYKLGTGYTWGGPPFVETINFQGRRSMQSDLPYTFKLRFRPD